MGEPYANVGDFPKGKCSVFIFLIIILVFYLSAKHLNQKPTNLRVYPFSHVSKWVSGTVCRGESPVCALKAGLYGESACL